GWRHDHLDRCQGVGPAQGATEIGAKAMLHRIATVPRRDTLYAWTVLLPILLLIGLIVYLPALNSLVFSFEFYKLRLPDEGGFVGLSNYIDILTSAEFLEVLGRSLFIIVLVLPLELLVGLAGALLLNERFPGRAFVRAAVLL